MNVCVVKNLEIQPTETFIRAHVETFGASVIHGHPPRIEGPRSQLVPLRVRAMARALRVGGQASTARAVEYASLFRTVGVDVVLAEYGTTGAIVHEACARVGLPLVVHFHGYDASRTDTLDLYREAYTEMFDRASALVVVSRAMRDRLIVEGAPADKTVLNPYGVDLSTFRASAPQSAPPTFLAVGRLVEKKAPHLLVLAFAEVHRRHPEARLRIIGDGDLFHVVRDLVGALALTEAVDLLGAQPHHIVATEMQRARAFVQHSVTAASGDAEGTPVSILEAGGSGLPVVSTHHAGIPDAVADGETGYIVDEHDVGAMADRMAALAADPGLAGRLGAAARARITEHYDRPRRIARLRTILTAASRGPLPQSLLVDSLDEDPALLPT